MTPKHIVPALLILAWCISRLPFVPGPGPAAAEGPPLVLAFYYSWYDMNTWSSGLTTDQPPAPYRSSDPATIARHVSLAQAAGIDALIQSWYGPQEQNNQTETNFRILLDLAAAQGFHAAVDFETTGPFFADRASVIEALRYLLSTHAQHPAYLRFQGKPVIFFWRQQRFSVDDWAVIRAQIDPNENSLWIAEGVDITYQAVFDGHHLYSIAWSADAAHTLDDWGFRVRQFEKKQGVDRLWVATAMPGYNDTHTNRSDAFAVSRGEGDYYRETWTAAIGSQPDWIVITSFNEWVEGTMIEPSVSYGDLYLNLTHELTMAFKSGQLELSTENNVVEAPAPVIEVARHKFGPEGDQALQPALQTEPYIRADEAVRVRAGPGTEYARVGLLTPGETAEVVGKNADVSWWHIAYVEAEDGLGWVSAEFVTLIGDPGTIPIEEDVTPSPVPGTSPTPALQPTALPSVALSPTNAPSATATIQPAQAPSSSATAPTSTSSPTSSPSSITEPFELATSSPMLTNTPAVRAVPAAQRSPVGLLWIGMVALVLALGLGATLVLILHRRR